MATIKVYSRMPNAVTFRFLSQEDPEFPACSDENKITLNGTTEVINHTLVTHDGALTLFKGTKHDLKGRVYSEDDYTRLKEHPLFKKALQNGDVCIGTNEDLSKDLHVGLFVTPQELQKDLSKAQSTDGESVKLATGSSSED